MKSVIIMDLIKTYFLVSCEGEIIDHSSEPEKFSFFVDLEKSNGSEGIDVRNEISKCLKGAGIDCEKSGSHGMVEVLNLEDGRKITASIFEPGLAFNETDLTSVIITILTPEKTAAGKITTLTEDIMEGYMKSNEVMDLIEKRFRGNYKKVITDIKRNGLTLGFLINPTLFSDPEGRTVRQIITETMEDKSIGTTKSADGKNNAVYLQGGRKITYDVFLPHSEHNRNDDTFILIAVKESDRYPDRRQAMKTLGIS